MLKEIEITGACSVRAATDTDFQYGFSVRVLGTDSGSSEGLGREMSFLLDLFLCRCRCQSVLCDEVAHVIVMPRYTLIQNSN